MKVKAQKRMFIDNQIREAGEVFEISDRHPRAKSMKNLEKVDARKKPQSQAQSQEA